MTSLDEAPDRYEVPTDPVARTAFRITNDDRAVWAVRRLRTLHARETAHRQTAEREIARIQTWLDDETRRTREDIAFITSLLQDYALRVRAETKGRRKNIRTPWGRVSTSSGQATFTVVDKDAFVTWAKENLPEAIKTTHSPLISVAKDHLDAVDGHPIDIATGDTVPGLAVNPARITATVNLDPTTDQE